ncbi:TPA: glucosaminidase domain-containing protein [Streptococcus pneumoniae]|nr:glucosaminidase domain-containing protein [Streptococcus pneumoniae]
MNLGEFWYNKINKNRGRRLMKKVRFIFLALLFFLASPEGAMASDGTWQGKQYLKEDGSQAANEWVFDTHYQSWFYIKADANYAENEWLKQGDDYFYLKSGGYMAKSEWVEDKGAFYYLDQDGKMKRNAWVGTSYVGATGAKVIEDWVYDSQYDAWFYIKSDGKIAEKEWVYDSHSQAWYYFKSGGYMAKNETVDGYQLGSDGKWLGGKATNENAAYYQVVPVTANVYDSDGEKLSYISQGSVVWLDKDRKSDDKRLAITISGLSGYMKTEDLQALDASKDFIPYYESDGHRFYHYVAQNASIPVASHLSDMEVGKKYYSADGLHFDDFKLENPFLFKDLTEATNYSAEELDKVFSLLNINNSLLENKGATFKEAEEHYHINALYLLAHSALESNWGRSKIAKDKNNFFGITAYDTTPYLSAKTFDDVDKGILGATKWIKENYIDRGRTFLGNKASGMNVEYASDPYWGEKIASVMMKINEKLGGKD